MKNVILLEMYHNKMGLFFKLVLVLLINIT